MSQIDGASLINKSFMTPVKNVVLDFEKETAISRKDQNCNNNYNNENNQYTNQTPVKIQNLFSELH